VATGGQLVVEQLLAEHVERVFCVPGESYLAVMDALYDVRDQIELVSGRHECGTAMMAVADAHVSGKPGVAFVTRGPGATNASIAVHIARQASIPLVLCVGQVARENLGREAFQEVDFEAFFSPIAKLAMRVDDPAAIPGALVHAFDVARSSRCGPVVVAFPEDVLSSMTTARALLPLEVRQDAIAHDDIALLERTISAAKRPMVLVGGTDWDDKSCSDLRDFAERTQIPVCAAFRRADIFDNEHPSYAGYLGIGTAQTLTERIHRSDCLIVIGARLDEPTTSNYQIPDPSRRDQCLVHIHPESAQLGLNYAPTVGITTKVGHAMTAFARLTINVDPGWNDWREQARKEFIDSESAPRSQSSLDVGEVMRILNEDVPKDAIVTTDAGNFSIWLLRYRRYCRPGRLIAPINGAMGYGVPAAIAASLAHPQRTVIGCVGDGGMLMTGMEIATAVRHGASPIILVFNNSKYGTIEMHQQRRYPGREIGNTLSNPDFSAFARSFGAFGVRVTATSEFADALRDARAAKRAAVIELVIND
jgi:acetolactate synthase-1/2/3 large subunit